jgi:colanic acid biosynthesis glycosyl transferase WcaI
VKKKVLLLTQFFPPETGAAANRIGSMAEVLSRYFDVSVVTLKPSYPDPVLYEGFPLNYHDDAHSYAVRRTLNFDPHKGALFKRAIREHLMALGLAARAVPVSADIVVVSSPTMFLGPVGLMLARSKRANFVWDVRDITWRYASQVVGASPMIAFGAQVLEKYMIPVLVRADLLIGATPGVTRILVGSGAPPDKTITISNGISPDLLNIEQKTEEGVVRRRPMVAYAGVFGYNQGIGVVLDVARMSPDVDFVLAGDGPELPLLKGRARKLGVNNVLFKGYLGKEQLVEVYKASDVLFAHLRSTPILDATAIPFKLYEYMATGRPIVYAGKGLAIDFLSKIGCAVTVPPDNPEAVNAAIAALLQNPQRMRALGLRGRAFVKQNFIRDKLMEELANALKERFG